MLLYLAASDQGSHITGERIGQHLNQRFLTFLDSTSSVCQSGPSRTSWYEYKSETLHTALCHSGALL